jgi:hypothetical protein
MGLIILQGFLILLIVSVILIYILGYGYLFNGISKTYLKGKLSANIDDGKFFTSTLLKI